MNDLTIGLLGALLATNQPQAVSNLIQQDAGVSVAVANPGDPAELELQKLMDDDDAAQAEVDKWIHENNAFAAQGAGELKEDLNKRILARFDSVRKGYEDFLRRHPDSARGHLAYGSFLNDIGDEDASVLQNETASQLDPKNPAAWNNLANYYGEHGPTTNAFVDYAKAIELNPDEPVYYQNFATTVYLFRKDAREFYGINEQQVFDKALELYRKAVQLAPDDFPLATDYAQSYYGIKPLRTNDALVAWTNALKIARDDFEREGVFIHLARIKIAAGNFAEAGAHLDDVTNSNYAALKDRLEHNLVEREHPQTNMEVATKNSLAGAANFDAGSTNAFEAAKAPAPAVTNAAPILTNQKLISDTSGQTVGTLDIKNLLEALEAAKTPASNSISSLPANDKVVPTNILTSATNEIGASTNIVVTNEVSVPANPPDFSPKVAVVLTNVPPVIPDASNSLPDLHDAQPPELRTTSTNSSP